MNCVSRLYTLFKINQFHFTEDCEECNFSGLSRPKHLRKLTFKTRVHAKTYIAMHFRSLLKMSSHLITDTICTFLIDLCHPHTIPFSYVQHPISLQQLSSTHLPPMPKSSTCLCWALKCRLAWARTSVISLGRTIVASLGAALGLLSLA